MKDREKWIDSRTRSEPGNVIVEVNRQPIHSVTELKQIASKLNEKDSALLLINRQGGRVFLVLKP